MATTLHITHEDWPLRETFTISRGAKRVARVVVAAVSDGIHTGYGECVPYARYGETVDGVCATLAGVQAAVAQGLSRAALQQCLPPGAARNALDCALWDIAAKQQQCPLATLLGRATPPPVATCYTISLNSPAAMAEKAFAARHLPLLKLKLGGVGDAERLHAVRQAVPQARLVVDANEAWSPENLRPLLEACEAVGVELVEQPLPAGQDQLLASIPHPIPICADESAHTEAELPALLGRYDAVNIKLDKTGGLTAALAMACAAKAAGLKIMVGCMVATSRNMLPAMLLTPDATWVDLDGPLLLEQDRAGGLRYHNGIVSMPG